MKKAFFLLSLTILLTSTLWTQGFIIRGIHIQTSKTTRSDAVLRYLEIVSGLQTNKFYTNEESLNADLEEAYHRLNNTLYFKDVRYNVQIIEEYDKPWGVELDYVLEDAWTLYTLPVLKYDSNYGLILGGVIRSHNCMGTMTDLTLGLRYNPQIWYAWTEWKSLRFGNMLWDIWFFEQFETIKRIDENHNVLVDFDYYSTELRTRTDFPLYKRWAYRISPGIYFPYNYRIRAGEFSPEMDETGLTPSLEHELSWKGVDWIGKHRSGLTGSISHRINFNVPHQRFQNILTLESQYFYNRKTFDAHFRALFLQSWGKDVELLAEYIRGLEDARLWGSRAFILNFSAGPTILDIKNIGELQLMPFCDAAFINGREPVVTFGIQLLAFLDFFPALPNTIYWGKDALHEGESEFKMYSGLHSEKQRFR